MKSWSLYFLEPSGPVQACIGIAFIHLQCICREILKMPYNTVVSKIQHLQCDSIHKVNEKGCVASDIVFGVRILGQEGWILKKLPCRD